MTTFVCTMSILATACASNGAASVLNCSFEDRMNLADAIKHVDVVVAQETYSPLPNVKRIKPDILMESASHTEEAIREAREYMESIGGRVIVIPYYPSESSTHIKNEIKDRG